MGEKKAEKASIQELVNNCKKGQKASQQGEDGGDNAGEGQGTPEVCQRVATDAENPGAGAQHCAVCGEVFPSRSKLFKHIEATGHAVLKTSAVPEVTAGKGKKKKR